MVVKVNFLNTFNQLNEDKNQSENLERWSDIDIELRQYNKMFGLVSGNRNLFISKSLGPRPSAKLILATDVSNETAGNFLHQHI